MSLNDRIKEARIKKGISQELLGKLIGVAKTTVSGYENNHEPTAAKLGEIADVLGVDINFLLQDEIKKSPTQESKTDERKQRLIKNYDSMNNDGKEALTNISNDMIAGGRYNPDDDLVTYRLVARHNGDNVKEIKGKRIDPSKIEGLDGENF